MAFFNDLPGHLRKIYDEGLDEVLIFAIIFILVQFSGNDSDCSIPGILPLIIIAAFLLLFSIAYRKTDEPAGF